MKKMFFSLAAIACMACTAAHAQTIFTPGVKVAANMSNYHLKDLSGYDSKFGIGASIGSFVNIAFNEFFAVQPELGIHFMNSEFKGHDYKNDMRYWGMDIPVYAVGQIPFSNGGKVYLGAGPYFGVGFSLKNTTHDINLYKEDQMKRFDFGGALMFGYEFWFGLQINLGYKTGFLNLTDKALGKMRPHALSLGAAWAF